MKESVNSCWISHLLKKAKSSIQEWKLMPNQASSFTKANLQKSNGTLSQIDTIYYSILLLSYTSTVEDGWDKFILSSLRSADWLHHTFLITPSSSSSLWNMLKIPLRCSEGSSVETVKLCGKTTSYLERSTSWTKILNKPWSTFTNRDKWLDCKMLVTMKLSQSSTFSFVKDIMEPGVTKKHSIQQRSSIQCSEITDNKNLLASFWKVWVGWDKCLISLKIISSSSTF